MMVPVAVMPVMVMPIMMVIPIMMVMPMDDYRPRLYDHLCLSRRRQKSRKRDRSQR
jgi:hypothetical protein